MAPRPAWSSADSPLCSFAPKRLHSVGTLPVKRAQTRRVGERGSRIEPLRGTPHINSKRDVVALLFELRNRARRPCLRRGLRGLALVLIELALHAAREAVAL